MVNQGPLYQAWQAPPMDVVNVNWDAVVDKQNQRTWICVIARDHEGNVLIIRCFSKPFILDPLATETLVALTATKFSRDLRLQNVILEGDMLQVVKA